jgi:predicted alpha-1,2-mannosidase
MRHFISILILFSFIPASLTFGQSNRTLTPYVNPFIGTGGHGHTYPGASLPFGMVQVSPDTRLEGWDGCSAYHASDSIIYGFSHTHLSGTGCSDYGDILVMPATGDVSLLNYDYASVFDRSTEFASPGYYKADLKRTSIKAELTATLRAGFHRYTFPQTDKANIVIDLKHRDKVLESSLKIVANDEIEGMRISQAWAAKQILFFVAKFSKPFVSYSVEVGDKLIPDNKEFTGDNIKSFFRFSTRQGEQILVKVGISAISVEGARKNLETEIPGWDFDTAVKNADLAWNHELQKIWVKGGSIDQKTIFYTSLYHALLNPNLYMDVDGQYRGRDLLVHEAKGFDYYTVFSLWDTYRAAHPLFTLIDQKRTNDFINTFLCQYEQGGMLPVWELSGNETGCMIGYHSVPVIADAYIKGIRSYNVEKAFEAMKHSAEQDHLGLKYHISLGFIPGDKEGESVSKTLEYAYDDWCIAQVEKAMGKTEDYSGYIRRAQNYKNLFDRSTGFFRAKMNGTWFTPFDPAEVNFNYTEANAWQYSFYVPQDLDGLIGLHGGQEKFAIKLDAMFSASSQTTGRDQSDITGLIGQYAHGNEPSHHMAYLYDYAGQPWKTQELVHRICKDLYTNNRDGLCGNEDCGQMSSWFVMSAMGFYPVTPGSVTYAIGTPLFEEVTLNLENGKQFIIKAANLTEQNYYIRSASLNGAPYNKSFINHSDIMKGGELVFIMGNEPNKSRGTLTGDYPVSAITDHLITPVPSVEVGQRTFMDSTIFSLSCLLPTAKIYYTLDGKDPTHQSMVYQTPITIKENKTLKARAYTDGLPESAVVEAQFFKIPENRKIKLLSPYAPQYSAGGDNALIDFLRGGENFRTGTWQGYEGFNLVAIIDLGSEQSIHKLSLGCFQDQGSWIFMPLGVDFYFSVDGRTFNLAASVKNDIDEHVSEPVIKEFTANFNSIKTRYLKVIARNRSICPTWHPGAGNKAWVFADEIVIE